MFSDLAATFNCHRRVTRMRYPEPASVACCVPRNPLFCGPVRLTLLCGTAFFCPRRRSGPGSRRPGLVLTFPAWMREATPCPAFRCYWLAPAVLMAGLAPAAAQNRVQPPAPAPAAPYQPVMITPPKPMTDESFEAMRKQLGEAAQRKDRAAMALMVVAQGFFCQRENRNAADKRKSGFDNLSARPQQQGGRRLGNPLRLC